MQGVMLENTRLRAENAALRFDVSALWGMVEAARIDGRGQPWGWVKARVRGLLGRKDVR